VGLEYRQALTKRWRDWLDTPATSKNGAMPTAQVAGFMEAELPELLAEQFPAYTPESLVVVAEARAGEAAATAADLAALKAWPRNWLDRVPALLWDYKAVLVDTLDTGSTPVVILVPEGRIGGKVPAIRLRLDQALGAAQLAARLEVETLDPAALRSERFRVVRGDV